MSNRRLKIAMVVAGPFPANHGTAGFIREMAEAMAQRGHELHVVTYHFGEGPSPKGVQIHRIPDFGFSREVVVGPTWERPFLDFLMIFTLCRVMIRENIDVIHAHAFEGALAGFMARQITRRPLFYNASNTMSDELPTYNFIRPRILGIWLAKLLDYCVPRMADRIAAVSPEIVSMLRAQGMRPDRLHMIPSGIDTDRFVERDPAITRERYSLVGTPLVMYTGILDRLQRIDYLLKAMQRVVAEVNDARLLLVATIVKEDDLLECQEMINELKLERHVFIATHTAFEEIPTYLASADVVVVCRPRCPGIPIKLLNYAAAGKPIVVFEGSAKGLQHMTSAFVVSDDDWEGLADGIVKLIRDPTLAGRLGDNARKWVRANLAWPKIAEEIENIYYDLLRQQGGQSGKH
jgi:1,2-diacylglycerol 3-alpha-glucosyltransferase